MLITYHCPKQRAKVDFLSSIASIHLDGNQDSSDVTLANKDHVFIPMHIDGQWCIHNELRNLDSKLIDFTYRHTRQQRSRYKADAS